MRNKTKTVLAIAAALCGSLLLFACGNAVGNKHVHDYTYEVHIIQPTCTEQGYREGVCSCGAVLKENVIDAVGHDIIHVDAKAPSCLENGAAEYEYCSRCDYKSGEQTIERLQHNYVGGVCTTCGNFQADASVTDGLSFTEIKQNGAAVAYSVSKGSAEIDGAVVIPAEYNGLPVTYIEREAFAECTGLTAVHIPDSVTTIGRKAFYNCAHLYNIVLPESITQIDDMAFDNCQRLISVTNLTSELMLPGAANSGDVGVWSIDVVTDAESLCRVIYGDEYVFYKDMRGNYYLIDYNGEDSEVTLPEKIEDNDYAINWYAFLDNRDITKIILPSGCVNIGGNAFRGCEELQYNEFDGAKYLGTADNDKYALIDVDDDITSFEFSEQTKIIGGYAFERSNITEISIPDHIGSIGDGAFEYCGKLKRAILPDAIDVIRPYTFYSCVGLTEVILPANLERIEESAFATCYSLLQIEIPSKVNEIGPVAFAGCQRLVAVNNKSKLALEKGSMLNGWVAYYAHSINYTKLEYIGDFVFSTDGYNDGYLMAYTGNDTEIVLPETFLGNRYTLHDCCFAGLSLDSLTIPADIGIESDMIFYNSSVDQLTCAASHLPFVNRLPLKSLTITAGTLDENALEGLGSVETLTIHSGVDISRCKFRTLKELRFVGSMAAWCETSFSYFENAPLQYTEDFYVNDELVTDVVIPNEVTSIGNGFYGYKKLRSVTISSGVTRIESYAFSGCSHLTSIEMPNSITSIGDHAFMDCGNLTSITIPSGVTSIGDETFRGCIALSSITIPNGVTRIEGSAFRGCRSLTGIEIPNSITNIYDDAFFDCRSLQYIVLPFIGKNDDETGNIDFRRIFGIYTTLDSHALPASLKSVVITGGSSIDGWTFSGCSNLTSIEIPNSVTSIGSSVFRNCSRLTNIEIPSNVTSIGSGAFEDCSSLTSIEIPNSVMSIGYSAFYGCDNITTATMPTIAIPFISKSNLQTVVINGGDSIEQWAFNRCRSLTSIEIPNSVTSIGNYAFSECSSLTSVEMPDSVTSIGGGAFNGCSSLTSIDIPSGVTSIEIYAFLNCNRLTSIKIPNSLTSIGYNAFSGCSSLASITIPNSVTSIENQAFYNCWNLTSIEIPNSVMSIGYGAFEGCSSLTLYCEAANKPSGWSSDWNLSNCPVVWDYKNK